MAAVRRFFARRRNIAMSVVLLAIAAVGAFAAARRTTVPDLPTAVVARGEFVDTLEIRGEIRPLKSIVLSSPMQSGDLQILKLAKSAFRVTMAAVLLIMGTFRAVGYVMVGAVTADVLILIGVALPLIGIGIVLGNRMHASLNQKAFNRLVGVLFVVIGTFLFVR